MPVVPVIPEELLELELDELPLDEELELDEEPELEPPGPVQVGSTRLPSCVPWKPKAPETV